MHGKYGIINKYCLLTNLHIKSGCRLAGNRLLLMSLLSPTNISATPTRGITGECGEEEVEEDEEEEEEGGEADTEDEQEEEGSGVRVVVP